MSSKIWVKDINVLIDKDYILQFIPNEKMTYSEKINSIVRFSLYLSLLLCVLKWNFKYLYILVITLLVTYVIYIFNEKNITGTEHFRNTECGIENVDCRQPTKDNPFMNLNILNDDYDNVKPSCKYTKDIDEKISNDFNEDLYLNTSDVYNQKNNQRQFYTMPNNRVPNQQKEFAEWLYKTPESCKVAHEGLLHQRRNCSFSEIDNL